jgi:tRNA-splicing ligase RtcB
MPSAREAIRPLRPGVWELGVEFRADMRAPVRVFASEKLLREMGDRVFEQAANVATLPGIVGASLCMSDAHWGYGFPIGDVAAMDALAARVPAGVGENAFFRVDCDAFREVLRGGAGWAVEQGYGTPEDLLYTEAGGRFDAADPERRRGGGRDRGAGLSKRVAHLIPVGNVKG